MKLFLKNLRAQATAKLFWTENYQIKEFFPSIDVTNSGTRKEELLVQKDTLSKMWVLRRILMQMGPVDAMEFLVDKLKQSKSNEDFFRAMNK